MPTIYKCPGCGAAMEFDSVTQKLGCPSCGMQIDVREYEQKYSQNSTQGDCHQDFRRFNMESFPEQKEMSKEDYVIICGDFGGVWNRNEESKKEKSLMDWLKKQCQF